MARHSPRAGRLAQRLTESTEGLLDEAGVPYERIDDADFAAGALDGRSVVILPYNRLDAPAAAALKAFAARGGKVVACFTTGAPGAYALLGLKQTGLRRPSFQGQFERIAFTGSARREWPVLPAAMAQNSWNAFGLEVLPGTRVLAQWEGGGKRTLPAVTANAHGVYVSHILTSADPSHKARFLLSCITGLCPDLWQTVVSEVHARARAKLAEAKARWDATRDAVAMERRGRIQARLSALAEAVGRLAPAAAPSDVAVWAEAWAAAAPLAQQARALTFAMAPSRDQETRGIWYFRRGPTPDWDAVMSKLAGHGLNCIFVRVSRAGSAIYKSDVIPQAQWAAELDHDEVARGIEAAHRHGMEYHAWHVCYHAGAAAKDYLARLKREGRLATDPKGATSYWLNPGDPRNADYECRAMVELVERYDVDGIHFDYIRYPDAPHYNFDYGPVSRREFEEATGCAVAHWPDDVIHGPLKLAYEDWERENINRVVRRVHRESKRRKPWVQVSAAVWQRHRKYRAIIKQDWPRWLEKGWLDFVAPMDYVGSAAALDRVARAQAALVDGRASLAVGIGSWRLTRPEGLLEQVEVSRRVGAHGFVLFSYNAGHLDEQLEVLGAGATCRRTPPAHRAPRFHVQMAGGLRRKDKPAAFVAGSRRPMELLGTDTSAYRQRLKGTRVTFHLEGLDGARLAGIDFARAEGDRRVAEVVVPACVFRLVAAGQVELAEGGGKPFLWRGPLWEGVTEQIYEQLMAERFPARVQGPGLRVGVYAGGLGAERLIEGLGDVPGLRVFAVNRLRPDHLAAAQVLVLQQLTDVADLDAASVQTIRQWVSAGGRLILTHDAVGFRWHVALFPEVGRGLERSTQRQVRTAVAIAGQQPDWRLEHSYADHVRIEPGPKARVLVFEDGPDAQAVVVGGEVGAGSVVLSGILPAYTSEGLAPDEKRLFAGLLRLEP